MEPADLSFCRDIELAATIFAGPEAYRVLPGQDRPALDWKGSALDGIGVRQADGRVARFGTDIYRHRRSRPIKLGHLRQPVEQFSGRMIYAGVIGPDFGHQLTQSLGRLWACAEFAEAELAYVATSPEYEALPGYFVDLVRWLGVTNPVRLVRQPLTVAELVVPQDLCNLHRRPSIAPVFARWLADRRPARPVEPSLSVYASRSGLDVARGQYLQETELESALAAEGYLVIKPEQMPIGDQIDLYLRAGRLIFADGSAAHLWSLFGHADQRAAMILRRPADPHIQRWFQGLPTLSMTFHDHRIADFSRRGGASGKSAALLDLRALWSDLRAAGFHRSDAAFGCPRAELEDWVASVKNGARPLDSAPFDLDPRSRSLLAHRPRAEFSRTAFVP
jgi:Glycosyltransferase 61